MKTCSQQKLAHHHRSVCKVGRTHQNHPYFEEHNDPPSHKDVSITENLEKRRHLYNIENITNKTILVPFAFTDVAKRTCETKGTIRSQDAGN